MFGALGIPVWRISWNSQVTDPGSEQCLYLMLSIAFSFVHFLTELDSAVTVCMVL